MQVLSRSPRAYAPSPDLVQRMVRETESFLNRHLRSLNPRTSATPSHRTGGAVRAATAAR